MRRARKTAVSRESLATGRKGVVVAVSVVAALLFTAGVTSASFSDIASLNLGSGTPGSGIGNPDRFDIATRDKSGVLQDADTPQTAVELPLSSGTAFSEVSPVRFEAIVHNRTPGITGDLILSVYDPDPEANDLFENLLFTIYLDGFPNPLMKDKTADEINAAKLTIPNVVAGEEHTIRIDMVLDGGTALASAGKTTQIGLRTNGESR